MAKFTELTGTNGEKFLVDFATGIVIGPCEFEDGVKGVEIKVPGGTPETDIDVAQPYAEIVSVLHNRGMLA